MTDVALDPIDILETASINPATATRDEYLAASYLSLALVDDREPRHKWLYVPHEVARAAGRIIESGEFELNWDWDDCYGRSMLTVWRGS